MVRQTPAGHVKASVNIREKNLGFYDCIHMISAII